MQITHFADLGLRVLMYLSVREKDGRVTITEIAEGLQASRNHLVKVVHRLGQLKLIDTARGKGGGLALARSPADYRLGDVLQALEDNPSLIDCNSTPCSLHRACNLRHALDAALVSFFSTLNEFSLEDAVRSPTSNVLARIQFSRPGLQQ